VAADLRKRMRWSPAALRLPGAIILGLALARPAVSAQLSAILSQQQLGVVIENVQLPQNFRKDLTSGLTSRILIQLSLLQSGQILESKVVDIAFKYDLWDENFSMTMELEGVTIASRVLARTDEVLAVLARLNVPSVFPVDRMDRSKSLTLAVHVLFNPVDRERLEEMSKWVAENSRPAAADPRSTSSLAAPPPTGESRTLFNRIFEQYASGAAVAAAFSDSGTSRPFKLEDLHDEPAR